MAKKQIGLEKLAGNLGLCPFGGVLHLWPHLVTASIVDSAASKCAAEFACEF